MKKLLLGLLLIQCAIALDAGAQTSAERQAAKQAQEDANIVSQNPILNQAQDLPQQTQRELWGTPSRQYVGLEHEDQIAEQQAKQQDESHVVLTVLMILAVSLILGYVVYESIKKE